MAQTGYTPISIYYSSTASNVPTAGNLVAGELAINTADGKLFYKDSSGVVQTIAQKGGNGVSSFSGGTTGLTPSTATTGVVTLAGTLAVANGGTGGTTSTGSGAVVLATSPTVTTPTIDKINTSVANTSLGAGNASIMKNRIINGAMVIDQRNAGASVTPTDTGNATFTLDRWAAGISVASKFSVQQNAGSVTPPTGFTNYLGVTSLSAYSVGTSDYFRIAQPIEGYNSADLGWGTANAKTVTLSFQVYSSLTGTFGGAILNGNNNYSYPFSYSIPVANTWTTISVTIAGPTGGVWATGNTKSIFLQFGLGVGTTYSGTAGSWSANLYVSATGATSVVGTNAATFYITGVQLEVGSSATGFEYRMYTTELQLCQRYYENNYNAGTAVGTSFGSQTALFQQTICTTNGQLTGSIPFKVSKRTSPTITFYNRDGTINQWLQGKQGQTESTYTPASVTNNQYMFGWSNSGIASDSNVHYGMFTASAEL